MGFRPYIYNACKKAGIKGYVQNIGEGVLIEADNKEKLFGILNNIPPLARIDEIHEENISSEKVYDDFTIKKSKGEGFAEIPPDLFLCDDCKKELNDPDNRRFKYFFITCTNCGPRFSITKNNPYDRHTTTMNEFEMCDDCKKEYADPGNRRYHAQTIACKDCGPKIMLYKKEKVIGGIKEAAELIEQGNIVAIKGIGGYHLSCKISEEVINNLRNMTGRKNKPYAIMCKDMQMAEQYAQISEQEKKVLESVQRPIVILKKKKEIIASELDTVGIMLPYTALHYLLFDHLKEPIIMTSSNLSDHPITKIKDEQIVDYVLEHNRTIHNQIDDSVIKIINNKNLFLRRSRGYVPKSIPVNHDLKKQVLALGAEMNNSFAIYNNSRIIISQYLGNTRNNDAFLNYKRTIKKFLEFTKTKPEIILADMHPEYNTSKYAKELSDELRIPIIRIQHHKAHAYSVALENDVDDFVAIICDGLGYGEDNTIWGGEIFLNEKRIGGLEPQIQLGGDSATKNPEKMLFSILRKFLSLQEIKKYLSFDDDEITILDKQLKQKFNCPITTSCGRILDAVSALLGFCKERTYDGRPAILLEANSTIPYDIEPKIKNNTLLTTPLFNYLIKNIDKDKKRLAATAQSYLARGLYDIAKKYDKKILFSGGCAYNKIMTSFMLDNNVLINNEVPSGDGGISFGQIGYYLANPGD